MKSCVVYVLSNLCLFSCSVSSPPIVKSNKLAMMSIADTNLIPILENAICLEKMQYYNDSLFFTIDVRQKKDIYELQIGSSYDLNNTMNYFEPILGYLNYKNYLFF